MRILFEKTGDAAYISLLDLQRVMQRALKRSKLPVWYTLGFNPHIYITFAAPLSLGHQSFTEVCDVKTESEDFDWKKGVEILNECLPRDIKVKDIYPVKIAASEIEYARYKLCFAPENANLAIEAFDKFAALQMAEVEKKGKKGKVKLVDLKQGVSVENIENNADGLCITALFLAGTNNNLNPALLLKFLDATYNLPAELCDIVRIALLTKNKKLFA